MDSTNMPSSNQVAPHYQPFHREAEELTNSFHARLEDPFNPMAMMIKQEADQLVSDIVANKHPQEVEDRIKVIQGHLRRVASDDGVTIFSFENQDFFQRRYSTMRNELQRMPHYGSPRSTNPGGNQGSHGNSAHPPSGEYHQL